MEIQKAGNNSTQIQAGVINIQNGITEDRAREIYKEEFEKVAEFTEEAKSIAIQRVKELEERLIPKISRIDKGLEFFSNPDFQFLLIEAQKTAARSERSMDYDLLSELLTHRVNPDLNREKRLGIKKAVEIVDSISDEALLGLTVIHTVSRYVPLTGDIGIGMNVLEDIFDKVIYDKLPEGSHWLDHLDLLGAVRIIDGNLRPILDYYSSVLNGYVCVGILKGSEDHRKAIDLLESVSLSNEILSENIFVPDHVRLCITSLNDINSTTKIVTQSVNTQLNVQQVEILKEIILLYSKDKKLLQQSKDKFSEMWDNKKSLKMLKDWWGKIPFSIQITEVGKVLAYANAKRYDSSLPPID